VATRLYFVYLTERYAGFISHPTIAAFSSRCCRNLPSFWC